MPRYRKKPVVIDAWEFNVPPMAFPPKNAPDWIKEAMRADILSFNSDGNWYVQTLETGELAPKHLITFGDFIIRGVKGEFYPCKPDIFAATYEPA